MELTVVIINFQTPDLLEVAVSSFRKLYPGIRMLVIDNGSRDDSVQLIGELKDEFTEVHYLQENIFHGPAMDLAIRELIKTKYAFFLDSDTETKRAGFLEEMVKFLEMDDQLYGIGHVEKVNQRGFKDPKGDPILLTPYMIIRCPAYKEYSPFIHHGQPTLINFKEARVNGMKLHNYNIGDYVFHHWRGTANRFGYGLGWRGKLDFVLNKLGI